MDECCGLWRCVPWLRTLRADMEKVRPGNGGKILTHLFLTYFFFCKALAYGLVMDSWKPLMGDLGVEATVFNDLFTVVRAPWAMKPMWAVMSDVFPCNGYKKRWYVVVAVLFSFIGILLILLVDTKEANTVALFFLLFVLGTAITDSMTQARYTELMKAAGNASIVSYVWALLNAGGFLAFYNLLLQAEFLPRYWQVRSLLVVAAFITPLCSVTAALNWIAEEQGDTSCKPNTSAISNNLPIFVLSTVTAAVAIGGVVVQLSTDPFVIGGIEARWYNGLFYCSGAVVILICCQICLPKSIALPAIYMFMCKGLYLNINFIQQTYFSANASCFETAGYPTRPGPNFSDTYYQTVSGYGGTIASLAGVAIFDYTVQYWPVRRAFWVTTFVNCFTTIFDLMIIERWTHRLFGTDPMQTNWPDKAFFILGANAIDRLLDMLDSLPQTVLIGKLCPKGMEAQVFAVLAALSNFGNSVAGVNGSIVAKLYGVNLPYDKATDSYDCTNPLFMWGITGLGWTKIWATFILPLLTIPFTWVCLPDVKLSDDMLGEDEVEMAQPNGPQTVTLLGQQTSFVKSDVQLLQVHSSKSSILTGGNKGFIM